MKGTHTGHGGCGCESLKPFRDETRSGDLREVRRVTDSTGFFHAEEVEVAVELVRERLNKGDSSGYFFVFADDSENNLAGYACYGPIACTNNRYDLYWIVVDPVRQGRGLGRRLLEESERRIRSVGGRRVYVETSSRAQYEPTRRFYEHCGYELHATVPGFYSEGDDKLIYARDLLGAAE